MKDRQIYRQQTDRQDTGSQTGGSIARQTDGSRQTDRQKDRQSDIQARHTATERLTVTYFMYRQKDSDNQTNILANRNKADKQISKKK